MENNDIKYCVTSFTDLLGFSSHLEIGNDLRTRIGQEAINRLQILEKCIDLFLAEKKNYSKYYPKNINYKRINDSLILTIDLPELLTPRIGEMVKSGITVGEIEHYFVEQELESYETFENAYKEKLTQSVIELSQFIGLVARIHSFINRKENEGYYPGAKTIIATGFRKSYFPKTNKEDPFSANFSFSNAYIAETVLKGQKLFVDNNVLQILSENQYIKNVLKISSFFHEQYSFDPFDDKDSSQDNIKKYKKGNVTEVTLFRKKYLFRELNPIPLAYIQLFPNFLPYLSGKKRLINNGNQKYVFRKQFYHFKNTVSSEEIYRNSSQFNFFRNDLEDNIEVTKQLILTEKSSLFDKKKRNNSNYE